MITAVFYTIVSVILVSIVSLIGILTLFIGEKRLNNILLNRVSLSAGTLLGGAFLHLIPEAVEIKNSFTIEISFLILLGIIMFFLIDKIIHWKHSHKKSELTHSVEVDKKSRIGYLNLIGDGVHNFVDGLIIAGSYMVNIPIGIATTIAVIVHETPQEIADFGILLYAGFSKFKALIFNFISAAFAIFGAIIGLVIGAKSEAFVSSIVPFAGGAFIYIAGSQLIPELFNKEHNVKDILNHTFMFVLGVLIMYGLLFFE